MLLLDLLDRKSAGVVGGLRVVGHPEILEAALARRLRHPRQRLSAVGGIGMTVQDAVQVVVGDQLLQFPLRRPLDFAASFARFRLDEGRPSAR